jgi:hypothetical protein
MVSVLMSQRVHPNSLRKVIMVYSDCMKEQH